MHCHGNNFSFGQNFPSNTETSHLWYHQDWSLPDTQIHGCWESPRYLFFFSDTNQLSNLSHPIPLFPPTHITCTLTCHWLWQFLCSIGQEFYLYINLVNTFHFKSELQGPKKLELKVLVLIYVCIDSWLIPEDRTDQQHVMSEPVIIVAEIKLHCIKLHSNYLMFMLGFPLH